MATPMPPDLDATLAARRDHKTQRGIPPTKAERERLRAAARAHVEAARPVPPLSFKELFTHTDAVARAAGAPAHVRKWLGVLVNNAVWRAELAAVPPEKRLLLLPKCLRDEADCPGTFDELGLVCKGCGRCPIHGLQQRAEAMGYAVLVSEGTAAVMALVRSGQVRGLVGVSCLSALEKVFPLMEAAAIPAVAVPLLYDGCSMTAVDLDWVWEALHLEADDADRRLDLDALRERVGGLFGAERLAAILGPEDDPTSALARAWVARSGKRWRPFLAVSVGQALGDAPLGPVPRVLEQVAVAVECFHKASLVHDDIEDGDAMRYGEPALHEAHGVPVALNVGDLLLGEGYRLIAEADVSDAARAAMLTAAAEGHRALAIGQGKELAWARAPRPLAPDEVLDIFRMKTAPAFEVALRLGAAVAGADGPIVEAFRRYSQALGIAYQVRDDLDDCFEGDGASDTEAARPSIVLALAYEAARGEDRRLLEAWWRRALTDEAARARVRPALRRLGADAAARTLLRVWVDRAVAALETLSSPELKGLLRRVIGRIFDGTESEAPRDALADDGPGRPVGAEPAA